MKTPRTLETVDLGAKSHRVVDPPDAGSDLGFLFCVCQRDTDAGGDAAPTEFFEGGREGCVSEDEWDDEEAEAARCAANASAAAKSAAGDEEALRAARSFGPVHEEHVMCALVASRLCYSDKAMGAALGDPTYGPYAQGLDFVDKVLPWPPS